MRFLQPVLETDGLYLTFPYFGYRMVEVCGTFDSGAPVDADECDHQPSPHLLDDEFTRHIISTTPDATRLVNRATVSMLDELLPADTCAAHAVKGVKKVTVQQKIVKMGYSKFSYKVFVEPEESEDFFEFWEFLHGQA